MTYTFTASRPGTFLYNSASRPDLQVEMGLAGAMIVRPPTAGQAYDDPAPANQAGNPAGSQYEQEYLFFLSEMDSSSTTSSSSKVSRPRTTPAGWPTTSPTTGSSTAATRPTRWRRRASPACPTQPYNALPRTHPGDRVLMRVIGGGHDMHPFHHHGQHARVIAVDGFPLTSTTPFDLSHEVFTIQSLPGQTVDAILRWTGKGLGWDIYGPQAR